MINWITAWKFSGFAMEDGLIVVTNDLMLVGLCIFSGPAILLGFSTLKESNIFKVCFAQ